MTVKSKGGSAASIAVISTGNNANASTLHLSKSRGGTSTIGSKKPLAATTR